MGGDNDCDSVYDLPQPGIRNNSGEIEMPESEVCDKSGKGVVLT